MVFSVLLWHKITFCSGHPVLIYDTTFFYFRIVFFVLFISRAFCQIL